MGTDDGVLQENPKDLIARHGLLWASGLREKRGRVPPPSYPYIPLVVSFNSAKVVCFYADAASANKRVNESASMKGKP
jgi:hypothetical protein